MNLADVRAFRAVTSGQAYTLAMLHVRRQPAFSPESIVGVRPVWFALLTCVEQDLKRLWNDKAFERWWKINAPVIAGIMRLAPQHIVPTHETVVDPVIGVV